MKGVDAGNMSDESSLPSFAVQPSTVAHCTFLISGSCAARMSGSRCSCTLSRTNSCIIGPTTQVKSTTFPWRMSRVCVQGEEADVIYGECSRGCPICIEHTRTSFHRVTVQRMYSTVKGPGEERTESVCFLRVSGHSSL